MLITGLLFIRLVHVILSFDRVLADAVDDDMRMDISGVVAAVCVGDNHCLIAGEILPGKVQTKLLRPFPGEPALGHICRVEADDVVMAFQFTLLTVFLKLLICSPAFNIESIRITVEPIFKEFFPKDVLPQFITEDLSCFFIMLEQQIIHCGRVIGIMAFYVLDNCQ